MNNSPSNIFYILLLLEGYHQNALGYFRPKWVNNVATPSINIRHIHIEVYL